MAMVARECLAHADYGVHILASDIDTAALQMAVRGVYKKDRVDGLSLDRLQRFFQRGNGRNNGLVRVKLEMPVIVEIQMITFNVYTDCLGHSSLYHIFCFISVSYVYS